MLCIGSFCALAKLHLHEVLLLQFIKCGVIWLGWNGGGDGEGSRVGKERLDTVQALPKTLVCY